ncbi:M3 family metallopeptidase [Serinibacter salmoneus]|uniref:Dipeptidyl carboxypeptidase n=1 Tax=Serinibacter salmoneus TaxID=556530 RepID=A0A2A9D0K0_9MICO|nr:M3 family metallopeptidase [Serinibacter salmoneus]PFG19785.1 peptidyl-dipeptidase Dcp [Serinibacter salmoneus]
MPTRLDGAASLDPSNPFAEPSPLPYGLPPLDVIRIEHIAPAFHAGIAQQRAEWEAVATDTSPASVANVLEPLERSGALLQRVAATLFVYASSVGGSEIDALAEELSPLYEAHYDAFRLDDRLFARYQELERNLATQESSEETRWLLQVLKRRATLAGVDLDTEAQARLREINARMSTLRARFGQREVAAMQAAAVEVTEESELEGLAAGDRAAFARSAQDRGSAAPYLITMILPTSQPVLTDARSRALRRRVQDASTSRGSGVDADSDTRETLLELVRLRAERARLLGYPHHAASVAARGTAATSEAVMGMLERLITPAVRNARAEAKELAALAERDDPGAPFEAGDWPFYADQVRRERFQVDRAALRPYLELDQVLTEGVFRTATELLGITFTERFDLPTYADGMRVWEVHDADGTGLGLFLGDYYARAGKRGGAWMTSFVDQSRLLGTRPVVTNTLNIPRPPEGQPTLLTWDEVNTLFHEFGHALHGLLSDVTYPSLSGTAVPRDFVEFPSQVNEMWQTHPTVLARYARHHETGESLDPEVAERLRESAQYGEGFATAEYLGAALLDQAWHSLAPQDVPTDIEQVVPFEEAALAAAGAAFDLVPPRYRTTYFNHIFAGDYDAGYYSYIWSEVLDADTQSWFEQGENDGLDPQRGRRYREALLSRGHSGDPMGFFRDLTGRDPDITPLLNRRGLA